MPACESAHLLVLLVKVYTLRGYDWHEIAPSPRQFCGSVAIRLDFDTLCDLIESLNSCWICRTECAPHASFTALGSKCQKPFLHVANTMIALQFCDQGGASSATLMHAGRKLFLLCDIYLLRPADRKSSMHFDL